jgi:hypothetical protein
MQDVQAFLQHHRINLFFTLEVKIDRSPRQFRCSCDVVNSRVAKAFIEKYGAGRVENVIPPLLLFPFPSFGGSHLPVPPCFLIYSGTMSLFCYWSI